MRLDIAKSGSSVKSWSMGFEWAYNRGVYTRVYNRRGSDLQGLIACRPEKRLTIVLTRIVLVLTKNIDFLSCLFAKVKTAQKLSK